MIATQKQKAAFDSLVAQGGWINPAVPDTQPFRAESSNTIKNIFGDIGISASPAELDELESKFGRFAIGELVHVKLIAWTDKHFAIGNNEQQIIISHKGMASGLAGNLEILELLPNSYSYPHGSDIEPQGKSNDMWVDDILGSFTTIYVPQYEKIALSYQQINTYISSGIAAYYTAINNVIIEWDALKITLAEDGFAAPLVSDFLTIVDTHITIPNILVNLETAAANLISVSAVGVNPLQEISDAYSFIDAQIDREIWWWENLDNEYNRIVKISTAASIALSVYGQAEDKLPVESDIIDRIGSPEVVAAKNEIF